MGGCLPATHLGHTQVPAHRRSRGTLGPKPTTPGAGPHILPLTVSLSHRSAPVVWSMKKHSSRSTLSFSLTEVSPTSKKVLRSSLSVEQPFLLQVHAPCYLPLPSHWGECRARFLLLLQDVEFAKALAEKNSENGLSPGKEGRLKKQYHKVS